MTDMNYRMICAHYPKDGHQLHAYSRRNEGTAKQGVIDANHKAELDTEGVGFYNRNCSPYSLQQRPVVEWEDVDA